MTRARDLADSADKDIAGTLTLDDITLSNDITIADNGKAIFGAGSDLQIYHDGADSLIVDNGTGGLKLGVSGTGTSGFYKGTGVEAIATFEPDGPVTLYHNNATKLATTSTGIAVTGNATFADNGKAIFGAGSDLQIYHDGSNSYIDDANAGSLLIRGTNLQLRSYSTNENFLTGTENGAVSLYYDGLVKAATTSTGIDVTGTVTADGLTVDGTVTGNIASFINDGNSTNAKGIKIQGGTDNGFGENYKIEFFDGDGTASGRISTNTGSINIEAAPVTINEGGSDHDFRVESDSNTHALFVDSGDDVVNINSSSGAFNAATKLQVAGRLRVGTGIGFESSGMTTPTQPTMILTKESNTPSSGEDRIYALAAQNSGYAASGNTPPMSILLGGWQNGSSRSGGIEFDPSDQGLYVLAGGSQVGYSSTNRIAKFTPSSIVFNEDSEDMDFRVESDGNTHALFVDAVSNRVSVGSNAPNATFGIQSTDDTEPTLRVAASGANGTDSSIRFQAKDSGGNNKYADIVLDADRSTGAIKFFTDYAFDSADEVLTLDNEGAVFNEGSASNKDFRVESDDYSHALYLDASSAWTFFGKTTDTTGETNAGLMIYGGAGASKGRIGVTSQEHSWFSRYGSNGDVIRFHRGALTQVGSISVTTTSTAYNTSSDHRLKKNVIELTGATDRLKQLEPKRFNFIADVDTTVDGFLAHEVQAIVPEAITGTHNEVDADGNPVYQGIDQAKLVPLLVATIKELEARITALENA